VALAAAIAILVPFPGYCSSCAAGHARCPHGPPSAPHHDAAHFAYGRCCHFKKRTHDRAATHQLMAASNDFSSCECSAPPQQQPTPPASRNVSNPQDSVAIFNAISVAAVFPEPANVSNVVWFTSLSPAVPHRILHCTWLI
jgi:hypothetical protein